MPDVDATVGRIESLIDELGQADPRSRDKAEEAIRLLMQLYGAGLARTIEILGSEGAGRLTEDKLVSSLLLLHGLHPEPAESRIREALHRVERRLDGHHVRLEGIAEEVARVRVELNGGAPPSTLAAAIERAIAECAPDIAGVEIEGLLQAAVSLVQIAPAASR